MTELTASVLVTIFYPYPTHIHAYSSMTTSQPFAPKGVLDLEADARYKADEMQKDIVVLQNVPTSPYLLDSELNNKMRKKAETFV